MNEPLKKICQHVPVFIQLRQGEIRTQKGDQLDGISLVGPIDCFAKPADLQMLPDIVPCPRTIDEAATIRFAFPHDFRLRAERRLMILSPPRVRELI